MKSRVELEIEGYSPKKIKTNNELQHFMKRALFKKNADELKMILLGFVDQIIERQDETVIKNT